MSGPTPSIPPAEVPAGFDSLFEFLPIGAYRSRPDGHMLRANRALVQLNGYSTEAELLHAVHQSGIEWYIEPGRRDVFRHHLTHKGVVRAFVSEIRRHRSGELCWVSQNAHLVRDAQGQALYFEGTVEDITERVQAEQALERSEAQFRQLAEQMPGMVFRLRLEPDGSRRYLYVSQGVRALYGVSPEEVLARGDVLDRFRHPDDRERLQAQQRLVAQGSGARESEFRIVLDDGRVKWLYLAANTVITGAESLMRVGLIVDITERHQAEALRLQRDRAEMAHQASRQLLSRASHELRTPLNAVLGFSQLMAGDARALPLHRRWAEHIAASGKHLLGLVDDVLDLSGAQAGSLSLNLADVEAMALVGQAWARVTEGLAGQADGLAALHASQPASHPASPSLAHHPQVVFSHDVAQAVMVRADPQRLQQVLEHLLRNAVVYNRAGGEVSVDVRADAQGVWLQVRDTGCGMDEQQLARLFTPFERLGAEARRTAGRGLGLALSRQWLQAMGGSISVQSTPDVGSTFTLWLPAAGTPESSA